VFRGGKFSHISGIYKVQTLLEALLPKTVIDEARLNRDKARKLTINE
ncbi:MAG: hypothetical protein HRT59_22190, partial [Crocosphaera sp.]|nr:hypothetical protein [Crocosphaera sp.]